MPALSDELQAPLIELLLSCADDKFMLGQRNADWTGLAPMLEEDIAFSSLAQDDLAHALALYEFVAGLSGRSADAVAYGRCAEEYRCCALVEMSDGFDWAVAIARQFFCDHFELLRLSRLAQSSYEPLRALAGRLLAEERLAVGHADQWVVRLGRGTPDSRERMQAALDRIARDASGLFEPTAGVERLEEAGIYPRLPQAMSELWHARVQTVVGDAGLQLRTTARELAMVVSAAPGGRRGRHGAEFGALLAELTEVYRTEPGGKW